MGELIFSTVNSLPLHLYSRSIRRTKVLVKSLSLLVAFVTVEVRIFLLAYVPGP